MLYLPIQQQEVVYQQPGLPAKRGALWLNKAEPVQWFQEFPTT